MHKLQTFWIFIMIIIIILREWKPCISPRNLLKNNYCFISSDGGVWGRSRRKDGWEGGVDKTKIWDTLHISDKEKKITIINKLNSEAKNETFWKTDETLRKNLMKNSYILPKASKRCVHSLHSSRRESTTKCKI